LEPHVPRQSCQLWAKSINRGRLVRHQKIHRENGRKGGEAARLVLVAWMRKETVAPMNWDVIEGKWDQIKGKVRTKWSKLTDDDVEYLGGKKDTLVGKLQERYGLMKDAAEREVDEWVSGIDIDEDEQNARRVARPRTPGAPPR
jgi:uncharacterized protein YjbJ (UPF0337 family)